jgi:hypothetical protein
MHLSCLVNSNERFAAADAAPQKQLAQVAAAAESASIRAVLPLFKMLTGDTLISRGNIILLSLFSAFSF